MDMELVALINSPIILAFDVTFSSIELISRNISELAMVGIGCEERHGKTCKWRLIWRKSTMHYITIS